MKFPISSHTSLCDSIPWCKSVNEVHSTFSQHHCRVHILLTVFNQVLGYDLKHLFGHSHFFHSCWLHMRSLAGHRVSWYELLVKATRNMMAQSATTYRKHTHPSTVQYFCQMSSIETAHYHQLNGHQTMTYKSNLQLLEVKTCYNK